jgi:hypothetical protein
MSEDECMEPFAAFVRRVAPEHAHLILAEIQRETDASHARYIALRDHRTVVKELEADLVVWEQLREQMSDTTPMHALLGLRIAAIRATLGGQ